MKNKKSDNTNIKLYQVIYGFDDSCPPRKYNKPTSKREAEKIVKNLIEHKRSGSGNALDFDYVKYEEV